MYLKAVTVDVKWSHHKKRNGNLCQLMLGGEHIGVKGVLANAWW